MAERFSSMKKIFFYICCGAWFINIGLFIFAESADMYDLKILALINMMLLSFVLLRDTK
tara:strand:+ start:947 stop:1123 length:177 start_codon:yes stop_codon:yes gene_type:complete